MPWISHSPQDVEEMLARIGVDSIDDLFQPIPPEAMFRGELEIPPAATELELKRELTVADHETVTLDDSPCFLGGGVYDHFIPSIVDHLAGRAEFYTAYTPYQPEASQGMLTAIFEYQSMIAALTGMDVSNASVYDGASALAEAVMMGLSIQRKRTKVVVSGAVHPEYLETVRTYLVNLDAELVVVDPVDDATDPARLAAAIDDHTACVAFQNPNFFGRLEDVFELSAVARKAGALVIASVDPVSLGVVVPPGDYDADIAVGEGQGLGGEVLYGGPYFGFFAAKSQYVRRMPGRIAGETLDGEGRRGIVLTFQTREQHIRRAKATSNICTNQGIIAIRGAIHMAALGPRGLREAAELCVAKSRYAANRIAALPGWSLPHPGAFVKEFVVQAPGPVKEIAREIAERDHILPGLALSRWFPDRPRDLLIAVTEKRTKEEIDALVAALARAGGESR